MQYDGKLICVETGRHQGVLKCRSNVPENFLFSSLKFLVSNELDFLAALLL